MARNTFIAVVLLVACCGACGALPAASTGHPSKRHTTNSNANLTQASNPQPSGNCYVCQVALNTTARVLADAAGAATRHAVQFGLRIPEGGRLLNPPFSVSLDPAGPSGCTNPPDTTREMFLNMAHVWSNAFTLVNSGPDDSATAWTGTLMTKTSGWLKDVILNFNHDHVSTGGFGAGFGFSIECGGQAVVSWGSGFGGGINALLGAQTAGYGGGGGGQHVQDFGGGCGCAAAPDGTPYDCGSAPDTSSEDSLSAWMQQGQAAIQGNPACQQSGAVLCGSGGGGGGYTSSDRCAGGFGGGFGFVFEPVSLSQDGGQVPPGSCSGGGGGGGGGGTAPASKVGPISRQCATECATKQQFNGCFCPCFKEALVKAGVAWGSQITCTG